MQDHDLDHGVMDRDEVKHPRAVRLTSLVAALALAAAVTACGSSNSGVSTGKAVQSETSVVSASSGPDDTTATTDTVPFVPPITEGPTTEPPPTEATTTPTEATTVEVSIPPLTAPPTTGPSTTGPAVPGGWTSVDTFPNEVFPPFDESNWTGVPSPALPAAGQPLADGLYPVSPGATPWSASNPNVLDLSVEKLVPCTQLPDQCIDTGDPFEPTELGVDPNDPYDLSLPLTAALAVGLTGYDCQPSDKTGNGADLAALFTAFDTAYNRTVFPIVSSGGDAIATLTAAPADGFSGESLDCSGGLLFKSGDAPTLLLQTAYNENFDADGNSLGIMPLTVTDEIHTDTLVVKDGKMTLYLYAGFFS
ncbi:MAG: hypothetical protein JWM34_1311 [Ilumatobacteraceae bacterium]|nr:hypothetical protein [Ilumatobacteraceae bacterium]